MLHLPDLENTDSREEISFLKWTKYNDRRKVWVKVETDKDKLNFVLCR